MSQVDYRAPAVLLRRPTKLWIAVGVLALAAIGWGVVRTLPLWVAGKQETRTYVAARLGTLDVIIRQDGELQSIDNIDITCPVEGQNTIQQIVPEGSFVKKGDIIAVLDATQHRQKREAADIELEKADADVKWSSEQKLIQEVKNAADLDAANSELKLAKIDLEEYANGEFPANRRDAERKLQAANISLKRKEEELANSRRLMQGGYLTLSEVQKAELDVVTARNEQEKAASDLEVLTRFKHEKDLAEKQNKVTQAENKVARVQSENMSNLAQKISDLNTKQKQLTLRKQAADHAREQFENCTIKAPADGMVLYASSVERYVYREQPIQAGAKVMQEQLLVRLPDTSKMKVVAKIPEARVMRLKVDPEHPIRAEVSIVGLSAPIGATLSKVGVLPDNTMYWMDPDTKNYPVDLLLDATPSGLKPGATAAVRVFVDRRENCLLVPIGSIYSSGDEHYVFTSAATLPRPMKVEIGESNETMVQITSGLTAGDEVLMLEAGQGRELLDRHGIKTAAPTSAPTAPTPPIAAAE
jgi:HlyD family secretion protein